MNSGLVDPKAELQRLETIVERTKASMLEMGAALSEIKSKHLYMDYGTWEEYCKSRWGLSRESADQILRIVKSLQSLPSSRYAVTSKLPRKAITTISQMPEEKQEEVFSAAEKKAEEEDRPIDVVLKEVVYAQSPAVLEPQRIERPVGDRYIYLDDEMYPLAKKRAQELNTDITGVFRILLRGYPPERPKKKGAWDQYMDPEFAD